MIVENQFDVPGRIADVFDAVTDIDRVARCFPGATLDQIVDEDTYKGQVKLRLGPVQVSFAGRLKFKDRNRDSATAELHAQGKEQKGRGGADADIAMALTALDDAVTRVSLHTDLKLVGAVAQYGRGAGVIQRVAEEIVGEFASNLEADIKGEAVSDSAAVSGVSVVAKAVAKSIKGSISPRNNDKT